ncbi:MAG: acyl-CoA dehydrogenase family protein, partial [Polymorphobacter sp.]
GPDRYIVNGSKIWTTHAHHADWMFCLARTNTDVKPQAGISFLLLRMDQPGVTVRPIVTMANDHEVNQVFLDNAEALVVDRLGDEGQGWTIAKFLLENERGGSSTAPRLLAAIRRLRAHAAAQPAGGGATFGTQRRFAEKLARVELAAQAFEITELRILAELVAGRDPGPQTSMLKLVSSEIGQQLDELAVEIFGYAGLQLPLERPLYGNSAPEALGSVAAQQAMAKYLNGRAWTIFGGTSEVQRNIIAKTVLGL